MLFHSLPVSLPLDPPGCAWVMKTNQTGRDMTRREVTGYRRRRSELSLQLQVKKRRWLKPYVLLRTTNFPLHSSSLWPQTASVGQAWKCSGHLNINSESASLSLSIWDHLIGIAGSPFWNKVHGLVGKGNGLQEHFDCSGSKWENKPINSLRKVKLEKWSS